MEAEGPGIHFKRKVEIPAGQAIVGDLNRRFFAGRLPALGAGNGD